MDLHNYVAYARRMFNEALAKDEVRAGHAMEEIQKLYTIEKICKEQYLSFEEIKEIRQQKSIPILTGLG